MKGILYILIFLLIISCINEKTKDIQNIDLKLSLLRTYDSIYHDSIKRKTYDIILSIKNKSAKPISFCIMTCSWDENFIINNDYTYFCPWRREADYPTRKHLDPNKNIEYKATIYQDSFSMYHDVETTKIGFIFIDSAICKKRTDFLNILGDKSKHDKIIWSNSLHLK